MVTHLPGFRDSIHDAQRTFRALLDANARPGPPYWITADMSVPLGLTPACGAACLTLLDLDVVVWLQPSFADQVRAWLLFHTGCRFTQYPEEADFALIQDLAALPELTIFNWGTGEKPEASTTLLVQVESFEMGQPVMLTGPGILDQRAMSNDKPFGFGGDARRLANAALTQSTGTAKTATPSPLRVYAPTLPVHFWDFWMQNHQAYPQGIDVFLFTENAVMGLPRTAKAEVYYDS